MRRFGLIGYPLSHSFSKKYFTQKFEQEGIPDCQYELYPIQSIDGLPALIEAEKPAGLNVTIPYKQLVLPFINELTEAVKKMQACNCIMLKDGYTTGFNTDVTGFEKTFVPHLKPHHSKVLVLGTGGASAAVAFTLIKLGLEYLFVSRSCGQRANCIGYDALNEEVLNEYTVIVNTTPVGTYPNIDDCPQIPYQLLTKRHYLYDLVYNPPVTMFLKMGKERGAVIENGERMLIIQAEESWKIWNGAYSV